MASPSRADPPPSLRRRLSVQGWLILFLTLGGLVGAVSGGHQQWLAASALGGGLLLCEWALHRRALSGLSGQWLLPRQIHAGQTLSLGLALHHSAARPAALILAIYRNGEERCQAHLPAASADRQARVVWPARFDQRGPQDLPPPRLCWLSAFGCLHLQQTLPCLGSLLLLPRLGRLTRAFDLQLESLIAGDQASLRQGDDDLLRLRDYRPGDQARDVAWKASARARSLLVEVRDRPQMHELHLVIDRRCARSQAAAFERLVAGIATIVDHAARRGWRLHLHQAGNPLSDDRLAALAALARLELDPEADPPGLPPQGPCLVASLAADPPGRQLARCLLIDEACCAQHLSLPRLRLKTRRNTHRLAAGP